MYWRGGRAVCIGEVAERFNAAVLKTVEGASPPRVRISASPPIIENVLSEMEGRFFCGGDTPRTAWLINHLFSSGRAFNSSKTYYRHCHAFISQDIIGFTEENDV